jgi:hypothetical protein
MVACHFVQGKPFFKAVRIATLSSCPTRNRGRLVNAVSDQAANGLIDILSQHQHVLHNRKKNSHRDTTDFPIVL